MQTEAVDVIKEINALSMRFRLWMASWPKRDAKPKRENPTILLSRLITEKWWWTTTVSRSNADEDTRKGSGHKYQSTTLIALRTENHRVLYSWHRVGFELSAFASVARTIIPNNIYICNLTNLIRICPPNSRQTRSRERPYRRRSTRRRGRKTSLIGRLKLDKWRKVHG